eukprot:CAMPEP_0194028014 /NCGR_PEP_ID=MMETSP0009_2-20130614/2043_1 /TAXON_ID=210454 /ORGANISM="Grammatophora oceanica, Strain CCMP 410" /LENGTH=67 /DNA_ID=CAMNT_0038667245 /DNA_START=132 /DNA_END=332 /DNA_ORIENTATION=+
MTTPRNETHDKQSISEWDGVATNEASNESPKPLGATTEPYEHKLLTPEQKAAEQREKRRLAAQKRRQ